ncbi:hypothetical protein scyTo_0011657 [Scyliorhinus torazame]|uniref:Alcohol dehydrogenase-like C-terminal domain-containing protein n=1 Tax=Scyliorhinus torazame TaxID=75743 RepID=A0A401NS62_SCYTO|nr:hypothetical protein [Scyliorhinus torazame]
MELAQKVKNSLCAMPDICLECTSSDTCIQAGVYAVKPGGIVVLVGMGLATANVPVTNATVREVDIRGSYRYTNTWHTAIALMASKKVDVKPLITHRFGLDQAQDGFELMAECSVDGFPTIPERNLCYPSLEKLKALYCGCAAKSLSNHLAPLKVVWKYEVRQRREFLFPGE